jgi:hypothetical protein
MASTQLLNPPLLEQNYLIRANRPWTDIEKSGKNLAEVSEQQTYDGMESDVLALENYSDVLQRSSRTIALAICLATHLRRFAPDNKFEEAMRALSSGLEFQTLDEAGRRSELERCLRAMLGTAMPDPGEFDVSDSGFNNWLTAIQKWLGLVNAEKTPNLLDVRAAAWNAWTSRLQALTQGRDEPTDLDYLRCRAEGSPAGSFLPTTRLSRATVSQLSDALTAALPTPDQKELDERRACPATLVLSLLSALRFDVSDTALMRDPGLADFYKLPNYVANSASAKGLLVIRAAAGSVTGSWKVNPGVPTISTTLPNAEFLFTGRVNLGSYLASRIHGVLFEDRPDGVGDRVAPFQAFLNRFPTSLMPRGGLLLPGPVPNPNSIPENLRRFAVAPIDQTQAIVPFASS